MELGCRGRFVEAQGAMWEAAVHISDVPELGMRADLLQKNEWEENGVLKHALS